MSETVDGPRAGARGRWVAMARRALIGASQRALDLALPPACAACSRPLGAGGALCAACWSRMRFIERPFCPRLAIPFGYDIGAGALSAEAIADPPPFAAMRAVAIYDETSRALVHGLKYRDRTELALAAATMMARAGADVLAAADLVVPVPLHRRRQWQRRFNQSALIASEAARLAGRPHAPDALERIKRTRQQVGLSAAERAKNVQGAFRVPTPARPAVAGRRIVLVDDVYTTGSTVKAATRALLRAGAAAVDVLVFARVVEGMD